MCVCCAATRAGWRGPDIKIYGRVVAAHTMTQDVASMALAMFMADITAKIQSAVPSKPHVVNCDNGSAFISRHFREFLADTATRATKTAAKGSRSCDRGGPGWLLSPSFINALN